MASAALFLQTKEITKTTKHTVQPAPDLLFFLLIFNNRSAPRFRFIRSCVMAANTMSQYKHFRAFFLSESKPFV